MSLVQLERITKFGEMGYGMFVHFGPAFRYRQGEWALHSRELDPVAYEKNARATDFSKFDMEDLVKTAADAGMKYITFTTRHHDGFSLYDTKGLSDYGVMHTPNGKDLMASFVDNCRKYNIVPFFYHTTLDWYQESFEKDFDAYLDYLHDSVKVLCTEYGVIGGLWFDGNWSKPDADWKLDRLYGMIREHQPDAIIVNNTGLSHQGVLSHPEIDSVTYEQGAPSPIDHTGLSKRVVGEVCLTMNKHWGISEDIDYKTTREILELICECRRYEANMLLNVSPDIDGKIPTIQKGILEEIGKWVARHKEAFYGAKPSAIISYGDHFAVENNGVTYLYMFHGKMGGNVNVSVGGGAAVHGVFTGITKAITSIEWLDNGDAAEFSQDLANETVIIKPFGFSYGENWIVRVAKINHA